MGPIAGVLFLLGGVAVLAVVLLPAGGAAPSPVLGGIGALAVLAGAALLRWGRRLARGAFQLLVLLGTALISTVVAAAPDDRAALALAGLYCFVAVAAWFFFAPPDALAHLATAIAAGAVVLTLRGVPAGTVVAIGVVSAAVAVVVARLVRRASSASIDGLTGLANRRGFDDALDDALAGAARTGDDFSVALVDVDHFKTINDGQGHAAGDELLRSLARSWVAVLPRGALLSRHGGDEFALLLPAHTGEAAVGLVEELRRSRSSAGLSIGVAQHRAGERASELMRRADGALYRAKAAGRGRSELDAPARGSLAADLAAALDAGVLTVHYQPLVRLADRRAVGVEALVRWTDPVRGVLSPAEFVPVAEQAGLIGRLGEFVFDRACREVAELCRRLGRPLLLSVNVSGAELTDPDYPARVQAVLDATGWPAASTVLEVTETLVDADSPAALRVLELLRERGLQVAIDDFGTGWSALSRLDALPADHLKLDRGFVSSITTSERRARLVHSVVDLSHAVGLELVAEGVETEAEAATLTAMGCRYAQGHLFGEAAPADVVARRLSASRPVPARPPAVR